jgi:hypothetical protein
MIILANRPMMAITTSSSITVKPFCFIDVGENERDS